MRNFISKTILLSIAFLFFNCESDFYHEKKTTADYPSDYDFKYISFNEFKQNFTALSQLKKLTFKSTSFEGKGYFNEDYQIFIDTSTIAFIEKDDFHSFTFKIYETAENYENLVLNQNSDGTYTAYKVTYILTDDEKSQLNNNVFPSNKLPDSIIKLENSGIGESNRAEISGPCVSVSYSTVSICHPNNGGTPIIYPPGTYAGGCSGYLEYKTTQIIDIDLECMGTSGSGNFGPANGNINNPGNYPFNPGYSTPGGGVSNPNNPGNSSPGGSISNPNNPAPILTTPLLLFAINDFLVTLTAEQKLIWINLTSDSKQRFLNLFQSNSSFESMQYAESLIDYLILNNSSPDAEGEINNILDILDDGLLDGQNVLVEPNFPIPNMAQYLSIFNTSQPAEITISADQPVAGSHFPISYSERAGHAIITIKQGTKIRSLGFYPQSTAASLVLNNLTLDPADFISVPSSFGNDENHDFDVSLSMPVTAGQLLNTIDNIKTLFQSNVPYNLKTSNCADFAITIFNSINIPIIPSCETPKSYWSGQTPATLGEVIRTMPLQPGTNRNIIGGNIPPNSTN